MLYKNKPLAMLLVAYWLSTEKILKWLTSDYLSKASTDCEDWLA